MNYRRLKNRPNSGRTRIPYFLSVDRNVFPVWTGGSRGPQWLSRKIQLPAMYNNSRGGCFKILKPPKYVLPKNYVHIRVCFTRNRSYKHTRQRKTWHRAVRRIDDNFAWRGDNEKTKKNRKIRFLDFGPSRGRPPFVKREPSAYFRRKQILTRPPLRIMASSFIKRESFPVDIYRSGGGFVRGISLRRLWSDRTTRTDASGGFDVTSPPNQPNNVTRSSVRAAHRTFHTPV